MQLMRQQQALPIMVVSICKCTYGCTHAHTSTHDRMLWTRPGDCCELLVVSKNRCRGHRPGELDFIEAFDTPALWPGCLLCTWHVPGRRFNYYPPPLPTLTLTGCHGKEEACKSHQVAFLRGQCSVLISLYPSTLIIKSPVAVQLFLHLSLCRSWWVKKMIPMLNRSWGSLFSSPLS